MEEAVPAGKGAMSAVIGLDRDTLDGVCREVSREGRVVEPANMNAPDRSSFRGARKRWRRRASGPARPAPVGWFRWR